MNAAQRLVVFGILVLAIVGAVLLLRPGRESSPQSPHVVSHGEHTLITQPEDGREPFLVAIDGAESSIDLAVYLLLDDAIITALERAVDRGVTVRVLLEEQPYGGSGNQPEIFDRLGSNGVDVRWGNPAFRFTHIKTFVIDGTVALIMTLNLSKSSVTNNREFAIRTTNATEVQIAAALFQSDWTRGAEPDPGPLVVSPINSRESILGLVDGATDSLQIYAEVISDAEFQEALRAATARGVTVEIIMSGGTESNRDRADSLANDGADVFLVSSPYIHAKMVLADGSRAYVGSENFTANSLDNNRELGIIVTEAEIVASLGETFASDRAKGQIVDG